MKFDELDFENSVERIQQDIAKAIGVPYVLLKSGNNANIDANQKLFYQHTILPILNQFCSAFKHFFNKFIACLLSIQTIVLLFIGNFEFQDPM